MEPFRDNDQLIAELRTLRPAPRPIFTAALDERAAAGFPRRPLLGDLRLEQLAARLRTPSPRRLAFSASAAALATVAIATAVVATNGAVHQENSANTRPREIAARPPSSPGGAPAKDGTFDGSGPYEKGAEVIPFSQELPGGGHLRFSKHPNDAADTASLNVQNENLNSSFALSHRDVERSASIVLGADPEDVAGDAARVSEAVHANGGIVLRSSISNGSAGHVGASFDLLIPSAKLDDAMAAFAQIDEVRLRHEGSLDITAPTVNLSELVKDSQARIDSLLAQLAAAETESAREAVEAELDAERRHQAALRGRLADLHRRAHFSRVSLRIESGASPAASGGGGWGVDNALHDAGHVLSVGAGVALIGLAVLAPLALIALIAWLAHRAWLRRARARALG